MYDLIVIGGGPAGLTATIYAIRKRLNVLLVTKDLGGQDQLPAGAPMGGRLRKKRVQRDPRPGGDR